MQIYKITNLINGKIYVGKDKNDRNDYFGSGRLIKRAVTKYGRENFRKEIIESCNTISELNDKEIFWILELKSRDPKIGYNIAKGGDGGDLISAHPDKMNIFKRISETKRLNQTPGPNKGIHLSEKTKEKISSKIKKLYDDDIIPRYRMSDDGRSRISAWMKEHCPTKTELGRMINSINNIGANNPRAKRYEFTDPNGEVHIVVGNIKDFCKSHQLKYKQIIKVHRHLLEEHNGWKCTKLD
jgi:group I intron endonuclease